MFPQGIWTASLRGDPRFTLENKADGVGFFPHERFLPLPAFKPGNTPPRLPTRTPRKTSDERSPTGRRRGDRDLGPLRRTETRRAFSSGTENGHATRSRQGMPCSASLDADWREDSLPAHSPPVPRGETSLTAAMVVRRRWAPPADRATRGRRGPRPRRETDDRQKARGRTPARLTRERSKARSHHRTDIPRMPRLELLGNVMDTSVLPTGTL